MASLSANEWNRQHATADEFSIFLRKDEPPSCSWWVTQDREAFTRNWQKELPRITQSRMAQTLRPILLGGKLP